MGKRVACVSTNKDYGCYAEYMVCSAQTVLPIPKGVSFETAASSFVNPLTVIAMCEITQAKKVKTVVATASASALGRMMNRYFQSNGIRVINVVRKPEQIEILKKEGADSILDQNDKDFEEHLRNASKTLGATICFDAVGGELTKTIAKNMPDGSTIYVYGLLSGQAPSMDAMDLIFKKKTMTGLWLTDYLQQKTILGKMFMINKVKNLLNTLLKTNIQKEYPLEGINDALKQYTQHMSEGKVLIKPQLKGNEAQQGKAEGLQLQEEQKQNI